MSAIRNAMMSFMAVALLGAGGTSCVPVCPDDLRTRVDPQRQSVRVGQPVVATASARGCRGERELSDSWHYFVSDTAIATIDSVSGIGVARAAGEAYVFARGRRYGRTASVGRIIVTP